MTFRTRDRGLLQDRQERKYIGLAELTFSLVLTPAMAEREKEREREGERERPIIIQPLLTSAVRKHRPCI